MRSHNLTGALAAVVALVSFDVAGTSGDENLHDRRPVFAHYMTCFFDSVEAYEYEIALAQRYGIDGFALNCGQWLVKDKKTGEWIDGPYVQAAARMYEAARRLDSGFKLFFSADMTGIRTSNPCIPDMIKRFHDHPNQFKVDGKSVLSTFAGDAAAFQEPLAALAQEGYPVFFVPNFSRFNRYSARISYELLLRLFMENPHLDGFFYFAIDDSINGLIRSNASARRAALMAGRVYMAGVSPAYNSANLRDFQGGRGYGAVWEGIVRDRPEWVEITTWNDYVEDSHLAPRVWHGFSKHIFDHDETFLQLTEYYAKWYRSGNRPAIEQDKLFYTYRNRSKHQTRAWDVKDSDPPQWRDVTGMIKKFDQIHDDVQDRIYATAFLTAPAVLKIRTGNEEHRFALDAGVRHVDVPMHPGVPEFSLERNSSVLLDFIGRKTVIDQPDEQNSLRIEHHQINRTWTGGAAAGAPMVLSAATGQLHPHTSTVEQDGGKLIRTEPVDGSGVTLPVKGLSTGAYNIRIRYINPANREARLTLTADGSPLPQEAGRRNPYRFPLFFPPTGDGGLKTVSFVWSLFDKTSHLKIEFQAEPQQAGRSELVTRLLGDYGSVLIDRVELVPVAPLETPAPPRTVFPDMVGIPGGRFSMGTGQGDPDEAPAHEVTLSPFAMSRSEITNEQYERFEPDHRQYRDGFSWRDDEPVIYVSWQDIARYCNWLSQQAGLDAAYDEKSWEVNLSANGFRMPTEAEWEYVATGRGENRRYPWGDEEPRPGLHGNFTGRSAVTDINPDLRSTFETGSMVVGSYPAAASRDGILDLAGNVGEWCSDAYHPYAAAAQTDPCEQRPSNYRVIRGGTWTYYNHSQRSRDREFNNPRYPGFAYIGARIVIPAAGFEKLTAGARQPAAKSQP